MSSRNFFDNTIIFSSFAVNSAYTANKTVKLLISNFNYYNVLFIF